MRWTNVLYSTRYGRNKLESDIETVQWKSAEKQEAVSFLEAFRKIVLFYRVIWSIAGTQDFPIGYRLLPNWTSGLSSDSAVSATYAVVGGSSHRMQPPP